MRFRNLYYLLDEWIGIDVNHADLCPCIPAHEPCLLHNLLRFFRIVSQESGRNLEKDLAGGRIAHYPSEVIRVDVEMLGKVGREKAVHLEYVLVTDAKW